MRVPAPLGAVLPGDPQAQTYPSKPQRRECRRDATPARRHLLKSPQMKIRVQNWPPSPAAREGGRLSSPLASLTVGGRSASLCADETTGELALQSADSDGGLTRHPIAGVTMFGDFGASTDDGAHFIGGKLPPRAASAEGRLDGDSDRPMAISVQNGFWLAAIPADAEDAFIRFRAEDGSPVQDCYMQPDAPMPVGGGFFQRLRNIVRRTPKGSATFVGGRQ